MHEQLAFGALGRFTPGLDSFRPGPVTVERTCFTLDVKAPAATHGNDVLSPRAMRR